MAGTYEWNDGSVVPTAPSWNKWMAGKPQHGTEPYMTLWCSGGTLCEWSTEGGSSILGICQFPVSVIYG